MQRAFYYAVEIYELTDVDKARKMFEGLADEMIEWLRNEYTERGDLQIASANREPAVPCRLYPDRIAASHSRGIAPLGSRLIRQDDFLWDVMLSDASEEVDVADEKVKFYTVHVGWDGLFKGMQTESTQGVILCGDLIHAYKYAELLLTKKAKEIRDGHRSDAGTAARPSTDVIN